LWWENKIMQAKNCRRILIAARAASGWLALLAPGAVARLWRLERPLRGDVSYLIRVFGIRNVILAYLLYQAERVDATDEDLEEMLRVGIAVDLFDTGAALVARSSKPANKGAFIPALVASLIGLLLGFWGKEKQIIGAINE